MTLKTVKLKNFKFYKNLKINLDGKNVLLFGENGSGKSSLYFALKRVLDSYFIPIISLDKIHNERNRGQSEYVNISVTLENEKKLEIFHQTQYKRVEYPSGVNAQNFIYFLNEDTLRSMITTHDVFSIFDELKDRFSCLDTIFIRKGHIEYLVKSYNSSADIDLKDLIVKERRTLDKTVQSLLDRLEIEISKVLVSFRETMQVKFEMTNSDFVLIDEEFVAPKIEIIIDEKKDYRDFSHEAKLKILALAIYFALMKMSNEGIEDGNSSSIKFLFLDDFLSSLDMGNRLYVMRYIFENFKNFQKIITTHNLMLFNVVKRLISVYAEDNQWFYKNIYFSEIEPSIYDIDDDYLKEANKSFDNNQFAMCGNLLRKEIERIVSQTDIRLEVSDKEKLANMMSKLGHQDSYYVDSQKCIYKINDKLTAMKPKVADASGIPIVNKLRIVNQHLNSLEAIKVINLKKFNEILNDLSFHTNILLNKSSHDTNEEHYRKEYQQTIKEVEDLREEFDKVRFSTRKKAYR